MSDQIKDVGLEYRPTDRVKFDDKSEGVIINPKDTKVECSIDEYTIMSFDRPLAPIRCVSKSTVEHYTGAIAINRIFKPLKSDKAA